MLQEDDARTGLSKKELFDVVRDQFCEAVRGVVTFAYLTGAR